MKRGVGTSFRERTRNVAFQSGRTIDDFRDGAIARREERLFMSDAGGHKSNIHIWYPRQAFAHILDPTFKLLFAANSVPLKWRIGLGHEAVQRWNDPARPAQFSAGLEHTGP